MTRRCRFPWPLLQQNYVHKPLEGGHNAFFVRLLGACVAQQLFTSSVWNMGKVTFPFDVYDMGVPGDEEGLYQKISDRIRQRDVDPMERYHDSALVLTCHWLKWSALSGRPGIHTAYALARALYQLGVRAGVLDDAAQAESLLRGLLSVADWRKLGRLLNIMSAVPVVADDLCQVVWQAKVIELAATRRANSAPKE